MAAATAEWRREQRRGVAGADNGRKTLSLANKRDGDGWQRSREKLLKLYDILQ